MIAEYEGKRFSGDSPEEIVKQIASSLGNNLADGETSGRAIFKSLAFRVLNIRAMVIFLSPEYKKDGKRMQAEIDKDKPLLFSVGMRKNPELIISLEE